MKGIRFIIFGIAIIVSGNIFAAAQFGDILIEGKDTFELCSNPLELYFEIKKSRTINGEELAMTSNACYRGYRATWELRNDSLFLVKIRKGCSSWGNEEPIYFNLKSEFGSDIVFAKWATGVFYSPRGGILKYVHAGYASIYEEEKYLFLNTGTIDSVLTRSNIAYEKGKVKPTSKSLSDTLSQIILHNIDSATISKFEDNVNVSVSIKFNKEGKLESIVNENSNSSDSYFSRTVYEKAVEALKDFPPLMKVTNERFDYAFINISFNSHCMKFPDDRQYGCSR